jgi:uncharacterized OB-fold protein
MTEPYKGPIPKPTPESRPFWEAAKQHRLLVQQCESCSLTFFYPRPMCPGCFSDRIKWIESRGRGRLHTFTINYNPPRNYPVKEPYVIGIVELDEGARLMSNIIGVDADPACLRCDTPVEVVFEDITETIALPKFRPVNGPS